MDDYYPATCYTCAKDLLPYKEPYRVAVYSGRQPIGETLTALGLTRICCRMRVMTAPVTDAQAREYAAMDVQDVVVAPVVVAPPPEAGRRVLKKKLAV